MSEKFAFIVQTFQLRSASVVRLIISRETKLSLSVQYNGIPGISDTEPPGRCSEESQQELI